jgi:Lon protease-like protein
MTATLDLPIFPLGTVLFPAGRLPLRIFEPRYVNMTRACLRENSVFGVALIRAGFEVGSPAIPNEIGCTARIQEWSEPSPGLFTLMARGETRFRIRQRRTQPDGLIRAGVELIEPPDPLPLPDRHATLGRLLQRLIDDFGAQHFPQPFRLDDAAWVGHRLAELLPVPPERKQKLLEILDPMSLLDELARLIRTMDS